jgi:hypothetical protein
MSHPHQNPVQVLFQLFHPAAELHLRTDRDKRVQVIWHDDVSSDADPQLDAAFGERQERLVNFVTREERPSLLNVTK